MQLCALLLPCAHLEQRAGERAGAPSGARGSHHRHHSPEISLPGTREARTGCGRWKPRARSGQPHRTSALSLYPVQMCPWTLSGLRTQAGTGGAGPGQPPGLLPPRNLLSRGASPQGPPPWWGRICSQLRRRCNRRRCNPLLPVLTCFPGDVQVEAGAWSRPRHLPRSPHLPGTGPCS